MPVSMPVPPAYELHDVSDEDTAGRIKRRSHPHVVERWERRTCGRPRGVVVADHPMRRHREHTIAGRAGRVLSGYGADVHFVPRDKRHPLHLRGLAIGAKISERGCLDQSSRCALNNVRTHDRTAVSIRGAHSLKGGSRCRSLFTERHSSTAHIRLVRTDVRQPFRGCVF